MSPNERDRASATVTYGYDAAGNFNFKSDFSLDTGIPYKLASGGLGGGGANAVKQVTLIGGGIRNYGYDASGNMTADDNIANQFAAKYDHANLATKLQRGAVINYFTYGPNNAKARQTGSDGSKVYLGGFEDWITAGQTKVSLGNYAQITNGTGGRVLHYFLTDRLGSVDAVTDGNGNLIETRGYDAFGAPRTGVWADASQIASTAITPKGFTSHEHLNSVKLIHMNGRMYDFQLGRFLGVDPFIQAPTNSQSLNPYSYIMNNPLSGTDPTGYSVTPTANDPDKPEVDTQTVTKKGVTVTATIDKGTGKIIGATVSGNSNKATAKIVGFMNKSGIGSNNGSAGGQSTVAQSPQKAMSGGRTSEGQAKAQDYIERVAATPGIMGGWMATPTTDDYDQIMGVYPCRDAAVQDAGISLLPGAGLAYSFLKGNPTDLEKAEGAAITTAYLADKTADSLNAKSKEKISTLRTSTVYGKSKQSTVRNMESTMTTRKDAAKVIGMGGKALGFAGIAFTAYDLKQKLDACPK